MRGAYPNRTGVEHEIRECPRHGESRHRRDSGRMRCVDCTNHYVNEARRRHKATIVAEAGGSCIRCGYGRAIAALEFHHRDPAQKSFDLHRHWGKPLTALRLEAAKCDLLCANCHREVDDGYR